MTNKERQASLDKKKYIESEEAKDDLSGRMNYCNFCKEQYHWDPPDEEIKGCNITQYEREHECVCATAYNRMVRKLKEKR